MIFVVLVAVFTLLLTVVTFVQTLYLESLRLIPRDSPALDFFKAELAARLGMTTTPGALAYSLLKHTLLVLAGASLTAVSVAAGVSPTVAFVEGFLIAWSVMLASSYMLSQILYRRTTATWTLAFVPALRMLTLLFRPLTLLLKFLESLFELSNGAPVKEEETKQEEEIDALIEAGEKEGILEKEDSRLIEKVVAFGDKTIRDVMTPRPQIVAISGDRSLDDLRQLVIHEQYSRIPIYRDSIDHIVGFVHVRDMFELDPEKRANTTVEDLMRPIDAVPESKPVSELLREMQTQGKHLVYVSDEYGSTSGLVTLEDLVEEILGEIRDEHEPADDVAKEPDGSITVSGSFDLDHLQEHFGFRPSSGTEASTVGGLVTEWAGEVPKPGEIVERDGLRIEVLAANELRVKRVRIRPAEGIVTT